MIGILSRAMPATSSRVSLTRINSNEKLVRLASGIFVALVCWAYLATSIDGVDARLYRAWENVISSGKLKLGDKQTVTASGFSFFQWTPNVACMGYWISFLGVDILFGLSLVCKCIFLFNCWRAFDALFTKTSSQFGLLFLLVSTPTGYYLRTSGTEVVALACTSVLLFQATRLLESKKTNWSITFSCGFLLFVSKSYLAVYALPVLAITLWDSKSSLQFWMRCILGFLFLIMAIILNGQHNQLMTGNFFQSPYRFGDEQFESLNLANPAFVTNILFDSYHGLLSTSPASFLGLLALIFLCLRNAVLRNWRLFAVWFLTIVAVFVNVWVNGCWYYWSMGELSFGMRGLVLVSLPSTVALLTLYDSASTKTRTVLQFCFSCCAVWSIAQLTQGPTSYYDWISLTTGQMQEIFYLINNARYLIFTILILLVPVLIVRKSRRLLFHFVGTHGMVLFFLVLFSWYIVETFQVELFYKIENAIFLGAIFVLCAFLMVFAAAGQIEPAQLDKLCHRLNWMVVALMFSSLSVAIVLFSRVELDLQSNKRIKWFQERDLLVMVSSFRNSPREDLMQMADRAMAFFERNVGKVDVIPNSSGLHSHDQIVWARRSGKARFR